MASVADQLPSEPRPPPRSVPWTRDRVVRGPPDRGQFPDPQASWCEQWATDEDVGHGFLVPVVAAWIAWRRRDRILAMKLEPAWWGLGVIAWGAAQGYRYAGRGAVPATQLRS